MIGWWQLVESPSFVEAKQTVVSMDPLWSQQQQQQQQEEEEQSLHVHILQVSQLDLLVLVEVLSYSDPYCLCSVEAGAMEVGDLSLTGWLPQQSYEVDTRM